MDNLNVAPVVQIASKRFSNETTLVYWVMVNPKTVGTHALIEVFDGWDDSGIKRVEIYTGYDRPCVFLPPIRCQDGLYVKIDAEIYSYTVGWRTEASLLKKD